VGLVQQTQFTLYRICWWWCKRNCITRKLGRKREWLQRSLLNWPEGLMMARISRRLFWNSCIQVSGQRNLLYIKRKPKCSRFKVF